MLPTTSDPQYKACIKDRTLTSLPPRKDSTIVMLGCEDDLDRPECKKNEGVTYA